MFPELDNDQVDDVLYLAQCQYKEGDDSDTHYIVTYNGVRYIVRQDETWYIVDYA